MNGCNGFYFAFARTVKLFQFSCDLASLKIFSEHLDKTLLIHYARFRTAVLSLLLIANYFKISSDTKHTNQD